MPEATNAVRCAAPSPPPRFGADCSVRRRRAAGSRRSRRHAALYKWTDANGRVVYSDQPPPGNVKVETMNAAPPPANPNAVQRPGGAGGRAQEAAAGTRRSRAKARQRRARTPPSAARAARVRQAQVQALGESQRVVYRFDEKGERDALDGPARAREQAELERWIATNCAK